MTEFDIAGAVRKLSTHMKADEIDEKQRLKFAARKTSNDVESFEAR